MKIILIIILTLALSLSLFSHWLDSHDNYHLVDLAESPDGKSVGVIIANVGGGGPGYCIDLVYIFPKPNDSFPDFSKEDRNAKFLHKRMECGAAKKLSWKLNELIVR